MEGVIFCTINSRVRSVSHSQKKCPFICSCVSINRHTTRTYICKLSRTVTWTGYLSIRRLNLVPVHFG
jgi:hypothetical protein